MPKTIELDIKTTKDIIDLLEKIESLIRHRLAWLKRKNLPFRPGDIKDLEKAQFLLKKLTAKSL